MFAIHQKVSVIREFCMGFDCSYQGFPENSDLIQKTYDDPEFAEDVF